MSGTAFTQSRHHCATICFSPRDYLLVPTTPAADRDFWIAQAICAVQISGFDLMVVTETKITYQDYCCNRLGYNVVCFPDTTLAAGSAQGGVGLVVWDQPQV